MIDRHRKPWEVPPPDKRLARAAYVLSVVWPAIKLYIRMDDYQCVHNAILGALHNAGVDVISDDEREHYGLPPRGPEGWTKQELAALEMLTLQAILTPVPPVLAVIDSAGEEKP